MVSSLSLMKKQLEPADEFYYQRESVDAPFIEHLKNQETVVVSGGARQGKKALIRHGMKEARIDYRLISCRSGWTVRNIYEQIVKEIDYLHLSSISTSQEGGIAVAAATPEENSTFLTMSGSIKYTNGRETTFTNIAFNVAEPADIIRAIKLTHFRGYIVLDDFHYLPLQTKKDFAAGLETFIAADNGIPFVISGIWANPNQIFQLNGELWSNLHIINAGDWSTDDLKQLIDAYMNSCNPMSTLNVTDIEHLIKISHNDLQTILQFCKKSSRYNSGASTKQIVPLADTIDSPDYYLFFLQEFAKGFKNSRSEYEMYRWLLYAIISSSPENLKEGLTYSYLEEKIRSNHPKADCFDSGVLTRALNKIIDLFLQRHIRPFLFLYDSDENNKILRITDPTFRYWLTQQDTNKLLKMLNLPTA